MARATDTAALLQRYRPVIRYDSQESFYADSVAIITDLVVPASGQSPRCNYLKNAQGKVIAAGRPRGAQAKLNLEFLTTPAYATGQAATRDDYLDETGHDYVADGGRMHLQPGYANHIYGHAVPGDQGRIWLQYWFFYYYNDKAFFGIGLHEGDWEMIQIRLDPRNKPDVVTYAQHREGERCPWANVEREQTPEGAIPVVYSARGSHASYFQPGVYPEAPVVPDYNDGAGLRVRPDVEVISDQSPAWARWPGHWGSTPKHNFFESDSPRGPHEHAQWHDPATFHAAARPRPAGALARAVRLVPQTPTIDAHREGSHAVVDYRFAKPSDGQPAPIGILVSVDAPDDERPPATYGFPVTELQGTIEHPLGLEERAYQVRASAFSQDGSSSDVATAELTS